MLSSVWRFWVQTNDVYFTTRPVPGQPAFLKASLHQSNKWRVAWDKVPENWPSADRVVKRWGPRPDLIPGWTHASSIIIPAQLIVTPLPLAPNTGHPDTVWLPPAPSGKTLNVGVMMGGLNGRAPQPFGALMPDELLLREFLLANGRRCAIAAQHMDTPPTLVQEVKALLAETRWGFDRLPGVYASSAVKIGTDAEGMVYFLDMALGQENFYETPPGDQAQDFP